MGNKPIYKATEFLHSLLIGRIKKGDVVVDATMGNGQDTFFLWEQVGPSGMIYAFDIQEKSIEETKKRFMEKNITLIPKNINLIHDGHENLGKYIDEPIDAAMFNLGYLPGGDKSIVTRPSTTIAALSTTLSLLKIGGIVSIIIYYGHEGGLEEKTALFTFLNQLDNSQYTVLNCSYMNHRNNPPIIVIIQKK